MKKLICSLYICSLQAPSSNDQTELEVSRAMAQYKMRGKQLKVTSTAKKLSTSWSLFLTTLISG